MRIPHVALASVSLASLATLAACAGDGGPDGATQVFELPFSAVVGDQPFACGETFNVGTTSAPVSPIDLRFYISKLEVVSAGEAVAVELDDDAFQGQGIALVDLEDDSGSCETGSAATHDVVTGRIPADMDVDAVRFVVGVPEELNHLDAATGPAPLNVPGLWWSWAGGYKFMKIDVAAETNPEFFFHFGATTCEGDPVAGYSCAFGNVAPFEIAGGAGTGVVLDLAELYAGVDVNEPLAATDSVPGCMAFAGDPECPAMFAPLGVSFESDEPAGAQTLFRSAP